MDGLHPHFTSAHVFLILQPCHSLLLSCPYRITTTQTYLHSQGCLSLLFFFFLLITLRLYYCSTRASLIPYLHPILFTLLALPIFLSWEAETQTRKGGKWWRAGKKAKRKYKDKFEQCFSFTFAPFPPPP